MERFKGQSYRPSIEFYETGYRDLPTLKVILKKYHRISSSIDDSNFPNSNRKTRGSSIGGAIHFAEYKAVGESVREPMKYYANNVVGPIDFCSLLSNFGIKKVRFLLVCHRLWRTR
jgi:UDP-glucose 4-epimerase